MYTKNTWQSGDIITKVKLDNMEDGIYDANYFIPLSYADGAFSINMSSDELQAAISNGKTACIYAAEGEIRVYTIVYYSSAGFINMDGDPEVGLITHNGDELVFNYYVEDNGKFVTNPGD